MSDTFNQNEFDLVAVRRDLADRAGLIILVITLLGAAAFRLYLLFFLDFPINDGALFLEFTNAAAKQFPALPAHVSYNGMDLPFAYPPLSFWFSGALVRLGFDGLQVVRILPILINCLYLGLFLRVLQRSGRSTLFVALAILFFSVTLRSFEWLLMGGGLSRGLGSIFFMMELLATGAGQKLTKPLSKSRLVITGVIAAGAILSHLEWGILTAATVVLTRIFSPIAWRIFLQEMITIGVVALLLISPWLAFVISFHGVQPFIFASQSGDWGLRIFQQLLEAILKPALANILILIGAIGLLRRRDFFWPAFAVLCVVLTPRHSQTPVVPALAILSTHGVFDLYSILPRWMPTRERRQLLVGSLVTVFLAFGVLYSVLLGSFTFRVLPREARDAMQWVAIHHPGTRFAIVNALPWPRNRSAEWFPTLSSAISVTTVQGREWSGEYAQRADWTDRLRKSRGCANLYMNLHVYGKIDFVWSEGYDKCFELFKYRRVHRIGEISIYQVLDQ